MASINFLYRSTKENSFLNIRLLFRYNGKDYVQGARTKLLIYSRDEIATNPKLSGKDYWNNVHAKRNVKDIDLKNKQIEVNGELNKLENHVLGALEREKIENVLADADWLKNTLENFYNPPTAVADIPSNLIGFFEYYLDKKGGNMSAHRLANLRVTKHKLIKFESAVSHHYLLNEIDENFLNEFVSYGDNLQYAANTQQRDLSVIKTICRYAQYLGMEIHPQLNSLKISGEQPNHIFLDKDEIRRITELEIKQEYLDNARDWLLISCYMGQRFSDFMRFNSSMIRVENSKKLIEFKQQKTKKFMTVPLSKEVQKILAKRKGEFPRAISSQNYNDYIKKVCKLAGIDELIEGKKRVSITTKGVKPKKEDYRALTGKFKKWELVSSHIGRRSFATNNYGHIPTTFLINITGHSTEKMFLNYISKSNKDLALESYDYFN